MRYIPLHILQEELPHMPSPVSLGRQILRTNPNSGNTQLILTTRANLDKKYITLLHSLNIDQICINDPLTDDIEIDDLVDADSFEQFQYHFDKLRASLYKLYIEIREKALDQQIFNSRYRTSVHTHIYTRPSFTKLYHLINDFLELFQKRFRFAKIPQPPYYVSQTTYIHYHAILCAHLAGKYLLEAGEPLERARNIFVGALLQDIGIMPDYYTKEHITQAEEKNFRAHPRLALMIINESTALNPLMGITSLHHHRYKNHSGFPRATKIKQLYDYKEGVHINGRIASVVNAYAAMSLFYEPTKVIDAISNVFSNFLFDSELAPLLGNTVEPYVPGTMVSLISGEKCMVKSIKDGARLLLRVIRDVNGNRLKEKKDVYVWLNEGRIEGFWPQDKKLQQRLKPHYPSIMQSYLTYN